MALNSPTELFRIARERAGLSIAETAKRAGVSESCIWDLEQHDDEMMLCYSPDELKRFASIFGVRPRDLIGTIERGDRLTYPDLVMAIREHCGTRSLTLEQFSEIVGWDMTFVANSPEQLLTKLSLDGAQDLCRQLGIEWDRFIEGL